MHLGLSDEPTATLLQLLEKEESATIVMMDLVLPSSRFHCVSAGLFDKSHTTPTLAVFAAVITTGYGSFDFLTARRHPLVR